MSIRSDIRRDAENIRAMREDRDELREDPFTYRPWGGPSVSRGGAWRCSACGKVRPMTHLDIDGTPRCCGLRMIGERE